MIIVVTGLLFTKGSLQKGSFFDYKKTKIASVQRSEPSKKPIKPPLPEEVIPTPPGGVLVALPDLTIVQGRAYPFIFEPNLCAVNYTVVVRNIGSAISPPTNLTSRILHSDGTPASPPTIGPSVPSLFPGESYVASFDEDPDIGTDPSWGWSANLYNLDDPATLRIYVDFEQLIVEINEDNNTLDIPLFSDFINPTVFPSWCFGG